MAESSFSDLPEGLITEILARLPVKSVLICKSVCKPWLSTISNPHFIKCQLQRAIINPSTLLVINDYAIGDEQRGTFVTLDMSPVQVDSLVMPSVFSAFPIVASCNGIVCLDDIAHNDYKVFGVLYETWPADLPEVYVYSANADSWRHFQDPVLENLVIYHHEDYNVVVKGVLYFYSKNELVSFDLHKEVFRLFPFPSFIQKEMSSILDFEGSVALCFQSDGNGPGVDLWTLDDASGQLSWSKKCNINLITLEYGGSVWPHYYLGAGLFWGLTPLVDEDRIYHYVLYNSEKREAKGYGLRQGSVHATLQYTDTLVTFDGFQQVEENAN